jgi:hypothetical protein
MTEKIQEDDVQQVTETDSGSDIQLADVLHVQTTPEQEARVLKKIDRL